jgi:hypothetical protein
MKFILLIFIVVAQQERTTAAWAWRGHCAGEYITTIPWFLEEELGSK